jgi:outer membrane murein-binding lipoprotein Lpp
MKKQLLVCAFALGTFLMVGCNSTPDNHETTITETESGTAPADTTGMEMDNTRVEIEEASAEVDSLLNDI